MMIGNRRENRGYGEKQNAGSSVDIPP